MILGIPEGVDVGTIPQVLANRFAERPGTVTMHDTDMAAILEGGPVQEDLQIR